MLSPASHTRARRLLTVLLLPSLLALPRLRSTSLLPADELPLDVGAAGLWQALLRLPSTATVLHIVAHPDDEDAALLTTLSRGLGLRTVLLSLTRGEGGANLISGDFFDALGVLRTLELLEADARYGVEQRFTRFADYGFSKTLEEALRSWGGEEEVLRDVVRVVREERPDIILARFSGAPRDGHGHHILSGVLARKAFDAAADSSRFPEQLAAGLAPWQAQKLYGPAPRGGPEDPAESEAGLVVLETGTYDPVLGRSYAQIAREGYSLHRSQGMSGGPAPPGPQSSRYRLERVARGAVPGGREGSLLEGLDVSFERLAELSENTLTRPELAVVASDLREAREAFRAETPEASAPALARALGRTRELGRQLLARAPGASSSRPATQAAQPVTGAPSAGPGGELPAGPSAARAILVRKEGELARALALSLGLELSVRARPASTGSDPPWRAPALHAATPGSAIAIEAQVILRRPVAARLLDLRVTAPEGWPLPEPAPGADLEVGQPQTRAFTLPIPADAAPTRPGWRRDGVQKTRYEASSPPPADRPSSLPPPLPPPPLGAQARVEALGVELTLEGAAQTLKAEATRPATLEPLLVLPALSIEVPAPNGILVKGRDRYEMRLRVVSHAAGPLEADVSLELPPGWTAEPPLRQARLERVGKEASCVFSLHVPAGGLEAPVELRAVARDGAREYREGFRLVTAPGLRRFPFYRPATQVLRPVDVEVVEGLRVGAIEGSGDEVPVALGALGITPRILSAQDLAEGDLEALDVILVGVRAYAVRDDLRSQNARLLSYVERGGVLIVQYQTPEFDADFGPFPYSMTWQAEEVSEEDAPVALLAPDHPALSRPNRITGADFDGWVEQRGSKFWKTWDERYTPLLECHDHGQEPQRGGLLVARHGKGVYVYNAYAGYRQLPFGVPGAFRLYANLLSLARTMAER